MIEYDLCGRQAVAGPGTHPQQQDVAVIKLTGHPLWHLSALLSSMGEKVPVDEAAAGGTLLWRG